MSWSAVFAALGAISAGVLINEVSDLSPWAGQRLARLAATLRYGRCERASIRAEEWNELIGARPGKFLKLTLGLVFFLDSLPRAAWRLVWRSPSGAEPLVLLPEVPHKTLAPRQRAALLILMVSGSAGISNPELRESFGLTISGSDRMALNQLGFVASYRTRNYYTHELTDQGWAWCAREIGGQREPSPGLAGKSAEAALLALTAGISRYMDRNGLTLSDIFAEGEGASGRGGVTSTVMVYDTTITG